MPDSAAIFKALNEVFRDEFPSQEIALTPATTAADVRGWDSMAHVRLILAIEERFGIEFSNAELAMLSDVGKMVDGIAQKVDHGGA